jgi:eukaryotic-like serine/threonine-protein kinase
MPLSPGTRLGSYEILAPLGAGGMGEVYRARDTVLKREVALKVLLAAVAHDPERMARFQREAELLASLSHPNIAIIHGLVESNGQRALVMELVPGETLSARIKRVPMPVEEALKVARQIAEALETAHERGVVHRDLKPGNVMITPDGLVKVLDFGLAAMVQSAPSASVDPFNSPTLTMNMTQAGVILGTAAYMSPEQAAGTPVDRRADIWSYGVVLWEMLSGRRLFGGDTIAHTLADVLRAPVDFDKLTAPAPIKNLVRRCLDRDPKARLRDIGEARVAIAKYLADPESAMEIPRPAKVLPIWIGWAAAAILGVAAILGWIRTRPEASGAPAADLALTIAPAAGALAPVGDLFATPEISPDGSAVIFYGKEGNDVQLRPLNTLTPELVRTGAFQNSGFWSPDSRSFAFSDGKSLKKMRVPDGAPEIVASNAATVVGGSWSNNGTIIFAAAGRGSALYTVAATGGVAKRIEVTGLQDSNLFFPEFLAGSEDFLFLATVLAGGIDEHEIYLATLRAGRATDPVLLMKNATTACYTPAGGGRILFVRNDNLYAQSLNRTARKLEGEPELVQQHVASSPSFGIAHFSVSRNGVVAWRPGTAGLSLVTIFDRRGKQISTAGSPTVAQTLKLSPDETRLLAGSDNTAWLLEPGQPGQQPLKQGDRETLWSRDGSTFFDTVPFGGENQRVVERPVTGEGPVQELAKPPGLGRLEDISPDGKTVLFSRGALDTAVFSFRLDGTEKEPKSLVQSGETISHARFSPDGRSIMYTLAENGIYVQPYPGPGLRKQVTSRGNYPVWRRDGREIVYVDEHQGRNYIWSVPVTGSGEAFRASTPSPLFPVRLPATTYGDLNFLAVSRDGSRFYIPQAVDQPNSDVIHIRMGWTK